MCCLCDNDNNITETNGKQTKKTNQHYTYKKYGRSKFEKIFY